MAEIWEEKARALILGVRGRHKTRGSSTKHGFAGVLD